MKHIFVLVVFSLQIQSLLSQNVTISGYVKDVKSGEALIGVNVLNTNYKAGTVSNAYGFYSITVKQADTLGLIFSLIGYKPHLNKIVSQSNVSLNVSMKESDISLDEVVVEAQTNDHNVNKSQMSVIDIPLKLISSMPVLGGETDVLKVIQFLPGVQFGQEGTTGFYVRGGNNDQNLVQLDEATIYNPSHLFGLFSSFNSNALNNVSLIKGGFPAQYGGRLSSILDITMKEGNKNAYSFSGGIGLISSDFTLEGPIVKDKSSFIISARRSYIDLIQKPLFKTPVYYFYDLNAKVNYAFSEDDKIYLSFFKGLDNAEYTGASSLNYGINFGNTASTLRWNHLFNEKLFSNTSIIYNDYHNSLTTVQSKNYAQLYSGLNDINVKSDLQYFYNSIHTIRMGLNYSYNTYFPASMSAIVPKSGTFSSIKPDNIPKTFSSQLALYTDDDITLSDNFGINIGVRIPVFIKSNINYLFVEPRITTRYSIDPATSIKLSYSEMNQFLHLVPNSTASLPTDIWISSSKYVIPQTSRQIALGVFKNFQDNRIESSIEAYYKTMQHQVLFKEGARPLTSTDIETQLTFGDGVSYGAEFFVKKNFGKLTGWTSYTLSWTQQQFNDLNYGKSFPFAYDKRHNLSLVASYEFNTSWSMSADFVFTSGGAFTLPTGRVPVFLDGTLYDGTYYDYTYRNNYRYRSYHRLDLNVVYHNDLSSMFGFPYESYWTFGLYNVYSRLNPYFIYLTTDPVTKAPQAKEVSLLPIIPSISWNFKF